MAPAFFDRTATAPAYVPVYTAQVGDSRTRQPDLSLHLFADCSLHEVCQLLWNNSSSWAHADADALVVSLVYPDRHGVQAVKRLGVVRRKYTAGRYDERGDAVGDATKTLLSAGFQSGDGLEVVDAGRYLSVHAASAGEEQGETTSRQQQQDRGGHTR